MTPSRARVRLPFDVVFPIAYAAIYAGIGLVLQLCFFPVGDLDTETDFFGDLVLGAQKLSAGHFAVANYPYKGPLYSCTLFLVHLFAGDWYRGAVILNALCSAGYLLLAYRFLLRLFGRRVTILATVFTSLVVEFFVQSHRASADMLFLLLSLGSIRCFVLGRGSWRQIAGAGALAGLAFLTRYNGIFLPAGALLALVLAPSERPGVRGRLHAGGVYLAAFLLVCAPWFVASRMETGQILATKNLQNVAASFYGGTRWKDYPVTNFDSIRQLIAHDPGYFTKRFLLNAGTHFHRDMRDLVMLPGALLVLAGLLGMTLAPPTLPQRRFYLFAVAFAGVMAFVFYAPRFFLPLALSYAAAGFAFSFGGGERRRSRLGESLRAGLEPFSGGSTDRGAHLTRHARAGLVAGAAVLFVLQAGRIAAIERRYYDRRPLYILEAGEFLRTEAARAGRSRVMARKGHIAYHARLDFQPYPASPTSFEDLLQFARAHRVDYIVYSQAELNLIPRLQFMAFTDSLPRLREIRRAEAIRIFALDESNVAPLSDRESYALLQANFETAAARQEPYALYLACDGLAEFHSSKQEPSEAARYLRRGLEVAERESADPQMVRGAAIARQKLAQALAGMGRVEEALLLLEKNVAYFERDGNSNDVAGTRELLGTLAEQMGRHGDALREFHQARDLFLKSGNTERAAAIEPKLQPH